MEYRRLGRSGLRIYPLVLGTLNFGNPTPKEEAFQMIDRAMDSGINLIDSADVYTQGESERIIGEAMKRNRRRKEIFITSKVFMQTGAGPNDSGNSKHHILESCEASLKRLKTDYIDIYFLHRTDFDIPQEESLGALDLLVKQGKVRYIGCSNLAAWQIAEAMGEARLLNTVPFVSVESEYNMLKRGIEKEILPCCRKYKLGIIPYFPLASGFLTGKYKRGKEIPKDTRLAIQARRAETLLTDQNFAVLEKLEIFAAERGHQVAELAFAWLLGHPEISSVIAGATSPEQVSANAKTNDWELTSAEMEELDGILSVLASTWDKPTQHLSSPAWAPR